MFIVVMTFSFVLVVRSWVHPKPWETFWHHVWSTGGFVFILFVGIFAFFPRKVQDKRRQESIPPKG